MACLSGANMCTVFFVCATLFAFFSDVSMNLVNTVTVQAQESSSYFRCHPAMRPCQRHLLHEQWAMARTELGLPRLELKARQKDLIALLGGLQRRTPVYLYITTDGVPIFMSTLLKVGSETIHNNLGRICRDRPHHQFMESKALEQYRNTIKGELAEVQRQAFKETAIFVRDPMDHFLSGMAEVFARTISFGASSGYTLEEVNSYPMENYLDSIIQATGKNDNFTRERRVDQPIMYQPEHLALISGQFFWFNYSIVKHLENFRQEWNEFATRFGFASESLEEFASQHNQSRTHLPGGAVLSDDQLHVHSRIRTVFHKKPMYLRALCRVLLVDYVCFPEYALPPECQATLNSTVLEARAVFSEGCIRH